MPVTTNPSPPWQRDLPMTGIEHITNAMQLAGRAVVADIEGGANPITVDGQHWWDVTPMVSPDEQPPTCIDMAVQAIAYALDAHIAEQHPTQPMWLRIVRRF